MSNTLASCIGWFYDVSIENDKAIIWIKTRDGQILRKGLLSARILYIT